jgi:hypothetical protein
MTIEMPVYQARIVTAEHGIFAMSFVDVPANECNFVALARSASRPVQMKLDSQKQILTGVVLVPDQMIYRNDAQLGEYYLKFGAQDIEKIRDQMMQSGVALRTTSHQHEEPLQGNHLVECWIVTDPKRDKAAALGLGELPTGTLVASYKITSKPYWTSQVMAGKVKGFSIEGLFNFKNVTMAKTVIKPGAAKKAGVSANLAAMFKNVAAMLEGDTAGEAKDLATVAGADATNSGTPYIIFELQDGTEIDVDSEGFCTMASDGSQAPAGDHTLQDGNTISIGDDGLLVETTDSAAAAEPDAAVAALRAAAKEKGKTAAVFFAKKEDKTPKGKEIATLKAKLAALEAEPSVKPAAATVEGGGKNITGETLAKLKGHERAAILLRQRNDRAAK